MVLTDSKKYADVLVIHPQTTAWSMYDGKRAEDIENEEIKSINDKLSLLMKALEHMKIKLLAQTIK